MKLDPQEIQKLQAYLQNIMNNKGVAVRPRPNAPDSAEVLKDGEFLAVVYKDVDEGETSYTLTMSILDIDIEQAA